MIFGKTKEAAEHHRQRKVLVEVLGKKQFAFVPVRLETGQYLWLQNYWSYCGWLDNVGGIELLRQRSIRRFAEPSTDHIFNRTYLKSILRHKMVEFADEPLVVELLK